MKPSKTTHGERIVKDVKHKTRRQYFAEVTCPYEVVMTIR